MRDSLGDRMKEYEEQTTGQHLYTDEPVIVRLDGRAFHTFTRALEKPYDVSFGLVMTEVARLLAVETNARIAYVQSDEITLVLLASGNSEIYFAGKVFKIVSSLAAQASAQFNRLLPLAFPAGSKVLSFDWRLPTFDCRAFNVPTKEEAVNNLIWRQADARRNAVSMAAQANFSHKELQGKNSEAMLEMLEDKGINYDGYPSAMRLGTFVQRLSVSRPYTVKELALLPSKHAARNNPDLKVVRTEYAASACQLSLLSNREAFVFDGAGPEMLR